MLRSLGHSTPIGRRGYGQAREDHRLVAGRGPVARAHHPGTMSDGLRRGAPDRAAAGVDAGGVDPFLDRGGLAGAEGLESGPGRFVGGSGPDLPAHRGHPRGVLPAVSGSAAGVLRRGLPAVHDAPGDGGAPALRRRGGAGAGALRGGRRDRWVPLGRHRASTEAVVGRARRCAARLSARGLRSGARAVPAADLLCRCRAR